MVPRRRAVLDRAIASDYHPPQPPSLPSGTEAFGRDGGWRHRVDPCQPRGSAAGVDVAAGARGVRRHAEHRGTASPGTVAGAVRRAWAHGETVLRTPVLQPVAVATRVSDGIHRSGWHAEIARTRGRDSSRGRADPPTAAARSSEVPAGFCPPALTALPGRAGDARPRIDDRRIHETRRVRES